MNLKIIVMFVIMISSSVQSKMKYTWSVAYEENKFDDLKIVRIPDIDGWSVPSFIDSWECTVFDKTNDLYERKQLSCTHKDKRLQVETTSICDSSEFDTSTSVLWLSDNEYERKMIVLDCYMPKKNKKIMEEYKDIVIKNIK